MNIIVSCIIINFYYNLQFVSSNSCFDNLICVPTGYNKLIKPPPKNESTTTNVQVEFQKIQILNFDENESTISIKLTLLTFWYEPRIFVMLNATNEDKKRIIIDPKTWKPGDSEGLVELPKEFINLLWLPNPYIPNVHKINKYSLVHDFEVLYYGFYDSLGKGNLLVHRIELETIIFCKMNFEAYPMDKHNCYFTLGSYAFLKQSGQRFELNHFNYRTSLHFNASQQVAQLDFEIDVKKLPQGMENCWEVYGTSQRTGFEITFQRKFQRYIVSYYIPSGILVVLSWVSNS